MPPRPTCALQTDMRCEYLISVWILASATLMSVACQMWARVLVGYLPKPNKNKKSKALSHEQWKRAKREILRDAMDHILAPIRQLCKTGLRMQVMALYCINTDRCKTND